VIPNLTTIARLCGIAVEWRDAAGKVRRVKDDVLQSILAALAFPCETASMRRETWQRLNGKNDIHATTADVGRPFVWTGSKPPDHIVLENGRERTITVERHRHGYLVAPIEEPGYHILVCGKDRVRLVVAPQRCFGIHDVAGTDRVWGIAAQTYSVACAGDGGIGHWGSIGELAALVAPLGADAIAISPSSAVQLAGLERFEPYAPSNRILLNPLLADASAVVSPDLVKREWRKVLPERERLRREAAHLIDWKASAESKLALFRQLFSSFDSRALRDSRFEKFTRLAGKALRQHALHEILSTHFLAAGKSIDWREWPERFRSSDSDAVHDFGLKHSKEIRFHNFLQWIAAESLTAAHERALNAGMRVGLVTDLTVGISPQGSQAWSLQPELLHGLHVGAPPDAFNCDGQDWGLTTFSPFALREKGFVPFIQLLRAAMQNGGGVRIDHIIGLGRLWVIPTSRLGGGGGAYLRYPLRDLLRILALESWRNRAVVIGEDLGTVPSGFSTQLARKDILGTRVLWFERKHERFTPARKWPRSVMATTTTHDLPTTAGWWRGRDVERIRDKKRFDAASKVRKRERTRLWKAFRDSGVALGTEPAPPATARVVDAALSFVASTKSSLAVLPLEDILGLERQPNIPGTINEHPNWRVRFRAPVDQLLKNNRAQRRIVEIARRRTR
jgi:4-alpha-glucanotransferase